MQTEEAQQQPVTHGPGLFQFCAGQSVEDKSDFKMVFEYYAARQSAQESPESLRCRADVGGSGSAARGLHGRTVSQTDPGADSPSPDPIFIVGLPRAGSTLLEQILASHSQVDGTRELPNILSLSQRLRRRGRDSKRSSYPELLAELGPEELKEFGEHYIEDTRFHREGAPFFIDKMPNNFRHIGLIQLILPNAKIIDARRHPMACCFSGYKQLFAEGQEFTYSLEDCGQYYQDYVTLMDHWDSVLPGKVLRVQYEDVVADSESQVRRILDYCGLPFEQACVDFYQTERSVRTPSSEQVRQPIFKGGLDQWRNFEPWLDPLKTALGPVLDRYPIK